VDKKNANSLVEDVGQKRETEDKTNWFEDVGQKRETEDKTNWFEDFIEKFQEKERQKMQLVEKTDYIKWLEKFTKEHPSFSDDTWLYKQDEISKEDYANVCKISTFFSVIERFADKNYFAGIPCDYGMSYYIEYNGKVYEIGTVIGQGAVSFCNTEDINKEATVINFQELANPFAITKLRTESIEKQLKRIDELFNVLVKDEKLNIPIGAIIERAEKVVTELKKK